MRTPRDRNGSFEPQIVRKGQRCFQGFDDKILALLSRGVSTRDIEAHLAEIYGVNVGRDLISRVARCNTFRFRRRPDGAEETIAIGQQETTT